MRSTRTTGTRSKACLADDLEVVAHIVLATVGRERDRTTFMAQLRALVEQSSDAQVSYEVIADLDEVSVLARRLARSLERRRR